MFCEYGLSSTDDICCERKKKQCALPLYGECFPVALWRIEAPADEKPSCWSCCRTLSSRKVLLDDVVSMNIREWEIVIYLLFPIHMILDHSLLRLEYTRQPLVFKIHIVFIGQASLSNKVHVSVQVWCVWKYMKLWLCMILSQLEYVDQFFPVTREKKTDKCMMPSVLKCIYSSLHLIVQCFVKLLTVLH